MECLKLIVKIIIIMIPICVYGFLSVYSFCSIKFDKIVDQIVETWIFLTAILGVTLAISGTVWAWS